MKTKVTLLQISRDSEILDLVRLDALNPVFIIHAEKKPETPPPGFDEEGRI